MIPAIPSGNLNAPQFGGVYRLVSHQYGVTHDIENPGRDNVLPYRVGQYLHPGSLPEARGTQWDNYYGGDNNFNILLDGPDLAAYNRQSDDIARIRQLATDPIEKNTLDHLDARLFVQLSRRAIALDVTAVQDNPQAYPIDPQPGNLPATQSATPAPANPMATLGPQAGFDSNAYLPAARALPVQASAALSPRTATPDTPGATSEPSGLGNLPDPQAMAFRLSSPGPLDPSALGGVVSNGD